MPKIDLTAFQNPKFAYEILAENGTDKMTVSLDFDKVGMDLSELIPTGFKQYQSRHLNESSELVETITDGKPLFITGIGKIFECMQTHEKTPEDLPSPGHLLSAISSSFQVPPHCGVALKFQILLAYLQELYARAEKKRDTAGSPNSSTPIPDSSPSTTSTPASTPESSPGCC